MSEDLPAFDWFNSGGDHADDIKAENRAGQAARAHLEDPFSCPALEAMRQVWEKRDRTEMFYTSGGPCPVLLALAMDPESGAWRGIRYARICGTWMASTGYDPARQEDPTDLRSAVAWILRAVNELARESLTG